MLLGNIICALHYQRMFFPCTFLFVEIALCLLHNRKISLTPKYEHNKNFYQSCLWIATPNKRYVRLSLGVCVCVWTDKAANLCWYNLAERKQIYRLSFFGLFFVSKENYD